MKCKCGKKAIFYRKYEGTYLCKSCFCRSIERKVKRTIRKYKLIKPKDKIAFALSGGKDSSLVLYLMKKIFKNRKDLKFFAISIDEGIKGYRDESLKKAKQLCKKLNIPHYVFSFKKEFGKDLDQLVKEKKLKEGVCTYCGVGRRWILNKKAKELGANKICFGHNLDDEIQGIFLDYIKGDLLRLIRMDTKPIIKDKSLFIPRIKPLREIPERESALYAIVKNLDFYMAECPYASGMRFEIRDFLNNLEENHPGVKFSIFETFNKILPYIKKSIKGEKIFKCEKCGEPTSHKICKTCELWK